MSKPNPLLKLPEFAPKIKKFNTKVLQDGCHGTTLLFIETPIKKIFSIYQKFIKEKAVLSKKRLTYQKKVMFIKKKFMLPKKS